MNERTDKTVYAGYWLKRFLGEYMVTVKNLSENTRHSYRDTFRMLLLHVSSITKCPADKIKLSEVTASLVVGFLDSLEESRGCSVQTRNQRLAAIKSFVKYVSLHSPEHLEWCRSIHNIPKKKTIKKQITYLEKPEMDALLAAPDKKTVQGWRDYVLLLFLYNTGVRAEEAASLKIKDISEQSAKSGVSIVTIVGKGRKTRRCPLWKSTTDALQTLYRNREPDCHVFINRLGMPMTRYGVYEVVTKYAKMIESTFPDVANKRVTPHTIRHTTATHLLQSGVDINTIRAWLGHVSINTTNIYAEVNMAMKIKALLSCEVVDESKRRKRWSEDKGLMAFLDNL
ncbi:MAG: site-specific integrase [Bacteroidaceae bacterium]|nr:site-specific integrase [Bacteroidaceae bacterium]